MLPKDFSYFNLRLIELLNMSFPEIAWNTKIIEQRSQWAANAYEVAFHAGNSIVQCDAIANYTLFEGLHFSKLDTVFKVVILASGRYPWTVIPVEKRDDYMQALEKASANHGIVPFTNFLSELVSDRLQGKTVANLPDAG